MAKRIFLHPVSPQPKRVFEAVDSLRADHILLLPTDTQYAIGCVYTNKRGLDRIRSIRRLDANHTFTLIIDSMTGLSKFAHISDAHYKLIKRLIPGPYTFILPATKEVPNLLVHPKRKTIGFRVPGTEICSRLLAELGAPILAVTAQEMSGDGPLLTRELLIEQLNQVLDLIVDDEVEPSNLQTTVLNLTGAVPVVQRRGAGFDLVEDVFALLNLPFDDEDLE
jgi:tRNA threonylcarbamoyl adenosine modification protein (Sua5/YciO/YrdC/YwlC family)